MAYRMWAKKRYWLCVPIHGVWEEGAAISPKEATAIQAENMTRGTTGVCVLAAQAGANVHVVDVGIDSAVASPGLSTCVSHEVAAISLQLRQ
ncbi:nicotinate-nucleotide--dimethylbenzimidazole phosphoribosyltransferase [Escherichia coli]